ncbi:MAG: hypothetical protein MI723_15825 [Caulobacterales bacterium]|nr:hypothetical protein [Caulobacterales bacterium]
MTAADGAWTVERRVSLALILAMVIQLAGALVWIGATAERLEHLEATDAGRAGVSERLARLEEQVAQARLQLDRIEARLEPR